MSELQSPVEQVDVFSYAMVIYEIICREVPFEDEELRSVGLVLPKASNLRAMASNLVH